MLRPLLITAAALLLGALSSPTLADTIYLRGEGQSKGFALRGGVTPTDDGKLIITREDGSTLVVAASRVVSIIKDDATLPAKKESPQERVTRATTPAEGEKKPTEATKPAIEKPAPTQGADLAKPSNGASAANGSAGQDTAQAPAPTKPQKASGYLPMSKGSQWEKSNGTLDYVDEVTDVSKDGATTTYSMQRSYTVEARATSYWKVICEVKDGVTTYSRKDGMAEPVVFLKEPCTVGAEWIGEGGQKWRVTSITEAYTDRGGNPYQNCARVDRINSRGVIEEGQQAIYAIGVGRVNDGLKAHKPAN